MTGECLIFIMTGECLIFINDKSKLMTYSEYNWDPSREVYICKQKKMVSWAIKVC